MQYYVKSKGLYANGGREWVSERAHAHCFGTDWEAAKRHAETFSDSEAAREMRIHWGRIDIPGHRDAKVIGLPEEE